MSVASHTAKDIAEAVCLELSRRKVACPKLEILIDMFQVMYFASLKTEESLQIAFHIVYLDPNNPDPEPPERIRDDRWIAVPLTRRIPLTLSNLVKIAKASDPRTSSFAIYHTARGKLFIWGLIDQGNRYHDYINHDSDLGPERPGLFQASITGAGHLVAYIGYEKIAELKINALSKTALDVLWDGPVSERLEPGIRSYFNYIKRALPPFLRSMLPEWEGNLRHQWIATLCRLLLRIRNYHHGGAILITPDAKFRGLNIKYAINYERLRSALEKHAVLRILESYTSDMIWSEYIEKEIEEIPSDLYLNEVVFTDDLTESNSELDGTIWFVSLLSRLDGLVVMNPAFEVKGFGAEITFSKGPSNVFKANSCRATKNRLHRVDYNHFGTRHRSMMRYCSQINGSVGFVISQDGDVRVITQVGDKLIMWEDIKLQHHSFVRSVK